jgi:transposase
MLFDAHYHAFRVLGGVPRRRIYDNMGTAVDRVGLSKQRQINSLSRYCHLDKESARLFELTDPPEA